MTNFSQAWEETYRANAQMSIWPWSDLVSYIYRYARPKSPEYRLLELGPGAGANIPLFRHLQVKYAAVEGSPSIVAALRERFPEYRDDIVVGDFIQQIPFAPGFDLIVDRCSLTCNNAAAIRTCLANLQGMLGPDGLFMGIDWFSTAHGDFKGGEPAEDAFTRTNFTSGQFKGLGRVHFSDEFHLRELFAGYELLVLDHKTVETVLPTPKTFASWNFVARRCAQ